MDTECYFFLEDYQAHSSHNRSCPPNDRIVLKDFCLSHLLKCTLSSTDPLENFLILSHDGHRIQRSHLIAEIKKLYSSCCELHSIAADEDSKIVIPHSRQYRYSSDSRMSMYNILKEFGHSIVLCLVKKYYLIS